MWNLISDLITLKENSVKFFSSRIGLFNALERTQELSQKGFWIKEWRKPRLKFNIGLALISLQTTGPRFTNYFPFHPSPLLWCRDHAKVKHIYFAIIIFFDMFSHAKITWKMFHNLYAWGAKICSCPNSFFVPVCKQWEY